MDIFLITPDTVPLFRSVLPAQLNVHCTIYGCIRDGAPCGAVVLEHMDQGCSLSWLWVRPDDRRKGMGGLLLDRACEHALRSRLTLSLCYPSGEAWTPALDYMVTGRGFSLEIASAPQFVLTRQQLLDNPYYQRMSRQAQRNPAIPMCQLRRNQLGSLQVQAESDRQFLISRTSFALGDPELSSALVEEDRVRGLLLVRNAGRGRFVLELLYLSRMTPQATLALLSRSVSAMLEQGLERLEFDCINDSLAQLAQSLCGIQPSSATVRRGILYPAMYQKGVTHHGSDL